MSARRRIAFVVSHPIQYLAPLYQRLAARDDVEVKVFFTWHAGERAVDDPGFGRPIAWDIPLTDGYDFELVPNVASDPGTHNSLDCATPRCSIASCHGGPTSCISTAGPGCRICSCCLR